MRYGRRRLFKRRFRARKRRFRGRRRMLRSRNRKLSLYNRYPQIRRRGSILQLKWADKQVFSKVAAAGVLLPLKFYDLPNVTNQIENLATADPKDVTFLTPPLYCRDEVYAAILRYRYWRIKSVKIFIKNLQLTSDIAAQAATQNHGGMQVGLLWHYHDAPTPDPIIDDIYIKWRRYPLKRPLKYSWYPRMAGWFDQKCPTMTNTVATTPNVKMVSKDQSYQQIKAYKLDDFQQTYDSTGLNSVLAQLNAPLVVKQLDATNLGITMSNLPYIRNTRIPGVKLIIKPDFKMAEDKGFDVLLKMYQYVTIEFKENTEVWNAVPSTFDKVIKLEQEVAQLSNLITH